MSRNERMRDVAGEFAFWALAVLLAAAVIGMLFTPWPAEAHDSRCLKGTGKRCRFQLEPVATETFACIFDGRTLSSMAVGFPEVTLIRKAQTDASPSAIVTASGVSGSRATVTIAPDTGCGASGCRTGNIYQVRMMVVDSAGNEPTCNFRLDVDKVQFTP